MDEPRGIPDHVRFEIPSILHLHWWFHLCRYSFISRQPRWPIFLALSSIVHEQRVSKYHKFYPQFLAMGWSWWVWICDLILWFEFEFVIWACVVWFVIWMCDLSLTLKLDLNWYFCDVFLCDFLCGINETNVIQLAIKTNLKTTSKFNSIQWIQSKSNNQKPTPNSIQINEFNLNQIIQNHFEIQFNSMKSI